MKIFIYSNWYNPVSISQRHSKLQELCMFQSSTTTGLWWRCRDQPFVSEDFVKNLVLNKFGISHDPMYTGIRYIRFVATDEFKLFLKLKQNGNDLVEF